jgi:hypothetical protein
MGANMTQSQKAIVIARDHQRSPKMDIQAATRSAGVDQAYVALGILALKYVPELVESVESGEKSLTDVYELAAQRKKQDQLDKPAKPNLASLRPGHILSAPTGTVRTAEARHTRSSSLGFTHKLGGLFFRLARMP